MIINNLPKSAVNRYGGFENIKKIHDIINFEMFYFKTTNFVISGNGSNGLMPSQCKTVKQQVEYCLYWFIKDIVLNNLIVIDIYNSIIKKLKENGKI